MKNSRSFQIIASAFLWTLTFGAFAVGMALILDFTFGG